MTLLQSIGESICAIQSGPAQLIREQGRRPEMVRCGLLLALACAGTAAAADVEFSSPPQATRGADGVTVIFGLKGPGDVEVAVIDAQGRVVRHLAAGVLGGKIAPPPPLQPGLSQKILWDQRDDAGKPAAGGPFKVRVRAGMSARFGRTIGGSPYTGLVSGVAADVEGNLYSQMGSYVGGLHENYPLQVRKFGKDGKYVRTLLPHPPSTDPAKSG